GAGPVVVVIAALAINLRLVLYSGSMARYWSGESRRWQALAAYLLIDPTLAVGVDGYDTISDRSRAHRHYLGAGVTLLAAWLVAGALATQVKAGPALPALVAAAVAVVAVRRSRSPHAALLVGMPVLWVMFAVTAR